jgi:circadian clock protein KaiC
MREGDKVAQEYLERVKSGINGLDEMMQGGFPFPSTVLVAGSAGTGKTTFALQFLAQGVRDGEQGIFFTTLSEPTQWMLRFVTHFTFLDKDTFGRQIKYVDLGPFLRKERDPEKLLTYIDDQISEHMPQRIVIDPVSVIGSLIKTDYRMFLYDLSTHLKNWRAISILTGEVLPQEPYPVEISYIVDSVVLLSLGLTSEGSRRKYLEILKMRGTQHATGQHLMDVSGDGITVSKGLR